MLRARRSNILEVHMAKLKPRSKAQLKERIAELEGQVVAITKAAAEARTWKHFQKKATDWIKGSWRGN
jgi:hypothetical protein